jgi:hypothetical protein
LGIGYFQTHRVKHYVKRQQGIASLTSEYLSETPSKTPESLIPMPYQRAEVAPPASAHTGAGGGVRASRCRIAAGLASMLLAGCPRSLAIVRRRGEVMAALWGSASCSWMRRFELARQLLR